MNENQQAAYIISQCVCALVQAMGMHWENVDRQNLSQRIAYGEGDFTKLLCESGLEHNEVISFFHKGR
jgi:hypothetical protein